MYKIWLLVWFYSLNCKSGFAETHILYDTKKATSDLDWTLLPAYNGWEEVSSLDLDGNTIRSYQVCNIDSKNQNNWARSPFIYARHVKRVYIEIEFSVMKCPKCRETFAVYYYSSTFDVASSTFPPWRENPYIKLDTLAASERFKSEDIAPAGINKKTLTIELLDRRGFYIAIQDEGACMSLMSLKAYYFYCPELVQNFAYFPTTVAGNTASALVTATGACVSNAVYTSNRVPLYRCNSNGEWMIPTSSCECKPGYSANATENSCKECPVGFYKGSSGNEPCLICPSRSETSKTASTYCQCQPGFYRSNSDSVDSGCTGPPSEPLNLTYYLNKTMLLLQWQAPMITGNRDDLYYSVSCKHCDEQYKICENCPSNLVFFPANINHVTKSSIEITNFKEFNNFIFKVMSHNGVSSQSSSPVASAEIQASTSQLTPSKVTKVLLLKSSQQSLTIEWTPAISGEGPIEDYEIQLLPSEYGVVQPTFYKVNSLNATIGGLDYNSKYQVRVRGHSAITGFGPYSDPYLFQTLTQSRVIKEEEVNTAILVGGCVAGFVLLTIIVIILVLIKRRKAKMKAEKLRVRSKVAEETYFPLLGRSQYGNSHRDIVRKTYVDYRDPHQGIKEVACEIEPSQIKIERVIGQGEFAEVCRGKLLKGKKSLTVAVKRLRYGASLIDQTNFFREACTMAQFFHPNVVEFKGIVTKCVPPMIVSEFMEQGSLDRFLQKRRGELSLLQLLRMLRGVASGMDYLSSMNYIHRDLAARNILVDFELICKVSDFGLSRVLKNDPHATYTTQGGKIALRWTAPECIRLRQFTSASDVWSFGVLTWEVMSYGEKPYWDLSNEDVGRVIEEGFRLPAPVNCPKALHKLMLRCWENEDRKRPNFKEILIQIENFMKQPNLLADEPSLNDESNLLLSRSESSNIHLAVDTSQCWIPYWQRSQVSDAQSIEKSSFVSASSTANGNLRSAQSCSASNGSDHSEMILEFCHGSTLMSQASTNLCKTPTESIFSSLPDSSTLELGKVNLSQAGALV